MKEAKELEAGQDRESNICLFSSKSDGSKKNPYRKWAI